MMAVQLVDSGPDIARYIAACLGTVLLATNFAFIRYAEDIFTKQTAAFWRIFFLGKSFVTGSSTIALFLGHVELVFGLPMLGAGYILSLYSLYFAWKRRPFHGVPLAKVVPTAGPETTLVHGKERGA